LRDNNFITGATWNTGLTNCAAASLGGGCQADYKTGTAVQGSANQLKAYDPTVFLNVSGDGLYGYDAGTPTKYTRKIIITRDPSCASDNPCDDYKVDVQVMWNYQGTTYTSEAEGYLYNWY